VRISVFNSRELQGVILALQSMDKTLQTQIRAATRSMIAPEWQKAVAAEASTRLERRVLVDTARVTVSNQNVTLKSAGVGRALAGGAKPVQLVAGAEFGANQAKARSYAARSSKGRAYTVHNRRTQRQYQPRDRKGRVVMPAAAKVIPRLASLWVQTTVRTFYEAIEKR
jgi:hypothetical protein